MNLQIDIQLQLRQRLPAGSSEQNSYFFHFYMTYILYQEKYSLFKNFADKK